MSKVLKMIVLGLSVFLFSLPAYAQESVQDKVKQELVKDQGKHDPPTERSKQAAREQSKGLDEQVQEIKTDVLGIAAELHRLEEKLLYPSDTQIAIFVSLAAGAEKFRLDAVDIELDGKQVAHHLYTFKELEALKKGGVQRIHVGNVRTGEHPLRIAVIGKTEGGSDVQREESFKVSKGIGPKLVGVVLAGAGIGSKTITLKDW